MGIDPARMIQQHELLGDAIHVRAIRIKSACNGPVMNEAKAEQILTNISQLRELLRDLEG